MASASPNLRNLASNGWATVEQPRLQRLDQDLFDAVAAAASAAPRRRLNHNLHAAPDLVQRFLNVLQPGTYVRPHRHLRDIPGAGFECFLVLQGAIGLLLFDETGDLIGRAWSAALQIDGSASADPTGLSLTYEWVLVSAPVSSALTTADIEDPTDMSPTFLPDVDGTYVFSLVVYNGFEYSPASVLAVTISLRTTNTPPDANAGEDETESSTVSCVPIAYGAGGYECPSCDEVDFELDGSASSDPDGDWVEVVEWTVLSGSATITDEDTYTPTVTMGSRTATYGSTPTEQVEIQLEVVDCTGATDTDVIILTHQCTGG